MKTKCLIGINTFLAFLLGLLGFSACESPRVEYGVPHADLEIKGRVSNEENQELSNIQIVHRQGRKNGIGILYWNEYADTLYTNSQGCFYRFYGYNDPFEYHRIIANDTSGIYASDSIDVTVSYTGGDRHWYKGHATLDVNFFLKKKTN